MRSSRSSSPVAAWMMWTSRSWMSMRTGVRARARPIPMWCRRPLTRRVSLPSRSMRSSRDAVVVRAGAGGCRGGFGPGCVGGRGGGVVGQRAVRAVVVVVVAEAVEQGLQLFDGGGLGGLGAQPVFEGLLPVFDFAAGGG